VKTNNYSIIIKKDVFLDMIWDLGPFSIDLGWLITFFSGVFFGFILMAAWYLVAVIASLNTEMRKRKVDVEDIDEKEIEWLIEDAHKLFKDKHQRAKVGFGQHLLNVSRDLSNDIATKFYPKSKYPYLELTLDESLVLLKYVSNRFNVLLNKPILKMFKGMTLRRLVTLNDVKTKVDSNLIVKSANKLKLFDLFKKSMFVLNLANPIYWFRRLVLDNVLNAILIRLGLVVISLTGEETYKIYSKKVFHVEKELPSHIDKLYQEMEDLMREDGQVEEE